jgi:hypothetical protein
MFCKYLKTEKDRFRPVATGLLSRHVLDLTHAQFYLISVPESSKTVKNWLGYGQKHFLYMYFVVNLPDPIIILRTAICHHKNNNNTDNHLYHVMLFI